MTSELKKMNDKNDQIIREIIELERSYFLEKRNVKSKRRKMLRDIIEKHTKPRSSNDDS